MLELFKTNGLVFRATYTVAEENFFSELEASGAIVIHTDMRYPIAEYKCIDIRIAIGPVILIRMRNLIDGYVVIFMNSEFEHEMEGDLREALSHAVDRLKIVLILVKNDKSRIVFFMLYHSKQFSHSIIRRMFHMPHKKVALQLIEETLKELESPKGSLLSAIQKLQRTADIINDDDKKIWCAIQLGEEKYTRPLKLLLKFLIDNKNTTTINYEEKLNKHINSLLDIGVKSGVHYSNEEFTLKNDEGGGGYNNIGFVEEKYADLVRKKAGNDGTYYKNNLNQHINYVRKKAHELSSKIFNQLKFSGTVSNCFDILKNAVDDKLLDLNPVIAEQLMLVFKAISSDKEEEWSQALTTCRRLLEGLADELYPASKEKFNGRSVGQGQYVNRLWAFMDGAIQSESNKDLAKAHLDFLGSWLDKVNKLTNKGVHAELDRIEAVKSVFHTYLVVADLLEYMSNAKTSVAKPDINKATLDELEALLNINRSIAKEIIKARVREGKLDLDILGSVKGIGTKTLENIKEVFVI